MPTRTTRASSICHTRIYGVLAPPRSTSSRPRRVPRARSDFVIPELQGKLDGVAVRAPVPDGSIVDFVACVGQDVSAEDVNSLFEQSADTGALAGILKYTDEPIVSSDVVGSSYSSIFDSQLTMSSGNLVKVFSWYDNEWGYSCRLVDLMGRL